jgi:hypothetical protein
LWMVKRSAASAKTMLKTIAEDSGDRPVMSR